MGTENSKIHPKRAPRSLLGVVFFRLCLRDFESHNLSIELRGRTVLATGAGIFEEGSCGLGRRCRRGDRSRSRISGRNGPGKRTGFGPRWGRFGRTLEASFEETSIEPDRESLHFEVRLGFANWSDFVIDFLLQVEVKPVSEGFVVPLQVLFL
jgi:hypothetical protein